MYGGVGRIVGSGEGISAVHHQIPCGANLFCLIIIMYKNEADNTVFSNVPKKNRVIQIELNLPILNLCSNVKYYKLKYSCETYLTSGVPVF